MNWTILTLTHKDNLWKGETKQAILINNMEIWDKLKYPMEQNSYRDCLHGKYDKNLGEVNIYQMSEFLSGKHSAIKNLISKKKDVVMWFNGAWALLSSFDIINTFELPFGKFPNEKSSEIVVCENDMNLEKEWVDFLNENYGKDICGLIGFRNREIESIKDSFETAKYITFTTTFGDWDWFEKLLISLSDLKNKIIVGHMKGNEDWTLLIPNHLKDLWNKVCENNRFKVINI